MEEIKRKKGRPKGRNCLYTGFCLQKSVKSRLDEFRNSLNLPKKTWNNTFTHMMDYYIKSNNNNNALNVKQTIPDYKITSQETMSDISFIEKPIKDHLPKIKANIAVVEKPVEPGPVSIEDLINSRYKNGIKPGRNFSSF